jgi:hypothetical protein
MGSLKNSPFFYTTELNMKHFNLLTSIFLVLVLCCSCYGQTDYKEDFKKASQEGKTWIIILSRPSCVYCSILKKELNNIGDPNLVVSDLNGVFDYANPKDLNERMALSLIKHHQNEKKKDPMYQSFNVAPDWVVYKYSNGKFKKVNRRIGFDKRWDLRRILKLSSR